MVERLDGKKNTKSVTKSERNKKSTKSFQNLIFSSKTTGLKRRGINFPRLFLFCWYSTFFIQKLVIL